MVLGRVVVGQHVYERIRHTQGALEDQLRRYRVDGRRVLSYWRGRRYWMFKIMKREGCEY